MLGILKDFWFLGVPTETLSRSIRDEYKSLCKWCHIPIIFEAAQSGKNVLPARSETRSGLNCTKPKPAIWSSIITWNCSELVARWSSFGWVNRSSVFITRSASFWDKPGDRLTTFSINRLFKPAPEKFGSFQISSLSACRNRCARTITGQYPWKMSKQQNATAFSNVYRLIAASWEFPNIYLRSPSIRNDFFSIEFHGQTVSKVSRRLN